jgi:hypothetical protein
VNNKEIDLSTVNNWGKELNWATDEDWIRAAANLEAETGVDILIGADLGNNLSSIEYQDLDAELERGEAASDEDEAQIEISLIRSIAHANSTQSLDGFDRSQ